MKKKSNRKPRRFPDSDERMAVEETIAGLLHETLNSACVEGDPFEFLNKAARLQAHFGERDKAPYRQRLATEALHHVREGRLAVVTSDTRSAVRHAICATNLLNQGLVTLGLMPQYVAGTVAMVEGRKGSSAGAAATNAKSAARHARWKRDAVNHARESAHRGVKWNPATIARAVAAGDAPPAHWRTVYNVILPLLRSAEIPGYTTAPRV